MTLFHSSRLLAALGLLIVCGMPALAQAAQPSWCLGPFLKAADNPLIRPTPAGAFTDPMTGESVNWEINDTYNPAATVYHHQVCVLYRAQGNDARGSWSDTSRLGLAVSRDGLHFSRSPVPVLYPGKDAQEPYEWPGGCEDPRCVETTDGRYVLTYTEWNGKLARLAVATSRDLVHWVKQGPAFAAADGGRFLNTWSKSGSIVSEVQGNHLVAIKIHGRYWMYWGEGALRLATSSDLIHWNPVTDASGHIRAILNRRPGKFDSSLVEGGPAAILFKKGIVVLYNGRNGGNGDPQIRNGAYCGGQALFDPQDPTHLLARTDQPYIEPTAPYEVTGQYAAGTVFTEGLVCFHHQWLLYYGTADTDVGMASAAVKASDGVPSKQ